VVITFSEAIKVFELCLQPRLSDENGSNGLWTTTPRQLPRQLSAFNIYPGGLGTFGHCCSFFAAGCQWSREPHIVPHAEQMPDCYWLTLIPAHLAPSARGPEKAGGQFWRTFGDRWVIGGILFRGWDAAFAEPHNRPTIRIPVTALARPNPVVMRHNAALALNQDALGSERLSLADPDFLPFILTPCFPSYPSNHGSGTNAAAEVMRRLYGEAGHSITVSNPAVPTIVLQYTAFEQIADDVSDARVYGGIHFRTDQDAGARLGRAIGTAVYKNNLRAVSENEGADD